ncbi:MAG: 50S ribosomal protein L15 [Nannocystis sp.]|jgi:large subunit ribosomal protein L15|nr:50S ribosomal protein L15 [Nannocystis sp.]
MGTTLESLSPPEGARKRRKRVGRGIGSRRGKTSTRGQKGQLARHNQMPAGFEGGQNPLQRRVPKRGFVNIHRVEYHGVNVGRVAEAFAAGEVITPESLHAKGIVPKRAKLIKLLGHGDVTAALKISVHAVSASAKEKIEAAGGSVEIVGTSAAAAE